MKKMSSKLIVGILACGLGVQSFAITPDQEKALDKLLERNKKMVERTSDEKDKERHLQKEIDEIAEIKTKSNEEIEAYLKDNDTNRNWMSYVLGASSVKGGGAFDLDKSDGMASSGGIVATFGPRYNFTYGMMTYATGEGFSLALPIGLGFSMSNNNPSFIMPIAIEGMYSFSFFGFGLGGGLRYTLDAREYGNLHYFDVYAKMNMAYGVFMEVGYVFYSTQTYDFGYGIKSKTIHPLDGGITFSMGWNF